MVCRIVLYDIDRSRLPLWCFIDLSEIGVCGDDLSGAVSVDVVIDRRIFRNIINKDIDMFRTVRIERGNPAIQHDPVDSGTCIDRTVRISSGIFQSIGLSDRYVDGIGYRIDIHLQGTRQ